jgi:hypothetical protein
MLYAFAEPLDFLARTKKSSFPNRKPMVSHPELPDGNYLSAGNMISHSLTAVESSCEDPSALLRRVRLFGYPYKTSPALS